MRIVKVHSYYKQPGGEDTVFHAETSLLRSYGHDVVEYIENNKVIDDMNRVLVAAQTLWSHTSYEKIFGFLKKARPDVVHFHNIFPLISPSAYYACQKMGIPVVQTLDNQRLICPASSFYRNGKLCLDCLGKSLPYPSIVHACYHKSRLHTAVVASMIGFHRLLGTWQSQVDAFLCSTDFYRDMFLTAGLPAEKLFVLPHFVQENHQSNPPKENGDYALFVGRLDPEKGVGTLLEAWRTVGIPLRIRGNGQMEEHAREFVNRHNIKNVEFLGRMEERDLSNLIGNSRFLVMPSEGFYETFGLVIIEAYSRSVPVLASNVGVTSELVSDKQTGLLFEAGNARDLAEKARWLWENPAEAKKMGKNGFKVYKEKFTQEQCYKSLLHIYETVLASK